MKKLERESPGSPHTHHEHNLSEPWEPPKHEKTGAGELGCVGMGWDGGGGGGVGWGGVAMSSAAQCQTPASVKHRAVSCSEVGGMTRRVKEFMV